MSIRIIFFDIDGTLIDMNKKEITEKIIETLIRLKERGVKICIATGRSPMLVPSFKNVEFDAFLTYNGSYCYDNSNTIVSRPLLKEDVYTIIRNAKRINRPLSLATKDRLASNGTDDDLDEYYSFSKLKVVVADDFATVAEKDEIYQIMVGGRKDEYGDLMKDVKDARITAWWDRAVDIIPSSSGKGPAISRMLEYYGITKEEAMAFGDGNNDIDMLKAVGSGIAMQNASESLKAVATEICKSVSDDGIYHYCLDHGLI